MLFYKPLRNIRGCLSKRNLRRGNYLLEIQQLGELQNPLTPVELLDRSVPNCAGPAVSTTLPKKGCETI